MNNVFHVCLSVSDTPFGVALHVHVQTKLDNYNAVSNVNMEKDGTLWFYPTLLGTFMLSGRTLPSDGACVLLSYADVVEHVGSADAARLVRAKAWYRLVTHMEPAEAVSLAVENAEVVRHLSPEALAMLAAKHPELAECYEVL